MTFEIYNIGDGLYLYRVCNAVAMLFNGGHLAGIAAVGFMCGLIAVALRAVLTEGKDFGITQVLVGYVLFLALFGTRATVVIHDMYEQPDGSAPQTRVVDNVPWGAAFAGSLISRLGFRMTELFEQSFGTVGETGITQGGFGHALETIAAVRYLADPTQAGSRPLQAFAQSVQLYVDQCTLPSMDQGLRSVDPGSIFNNPDPLAGIHHDPSGEQGGMWLTESLLTSSGGVATDLERETISCSDAMTRLESFRDNEALGAADAALAPVMGARATERMQAQLAALGSHAADDMRNYIAALVIARAYDAAAAGGSVSNPHQVASDIMLTSAIEQRTTQWAAEADLFHRVAQPMMSFFSALIFALVPFMAFLVGLGQTGITLMMRYCLLGIWVSLWPATMAIVQLYFNTQAENFIERLNNAAAGDSAVGVTSIQAVTDLTQRSLDWLSSAATLAASTPALTLMLLFGGAVTATYLAGRLQGGDHVNEKIASPDAMAPSPALSTSSSYSSDPMLGAHRTGSSQMLPNLSVGTAGSRTVSSAEQASRSASLQFMDSLSNAVRESGGSSESWQSAVTEALRHGAQADSSFATSLARDFGYDETMSKSDGTTDTRGFDAKFGFGSRGQGGLKKEGALGGAAAGAAKGGRGGVIGAAAGAVLSMVDATWSSSTRTSTEQGNDFNQRFAERWQNDEGFRASVGRALAAGWEDASRRVDETGVSADVARGLSRQAADATQASETYSDTAQQVRAMGTSQSVPLLAAANGFVQNGVANGQSSPGQALFDRAEAMGVPRQALNEAYATTSQSAATEDVARAAAAMWVLSDVPGAMANQGYDVSAPQWQGLVAGADMLYVDALAESGRFGGNSSALSPGAAASAAGAFSGVGDVAPDFGTVSEQGGALRAPSHSVGAVMGEASSMVDLGQSHMESVNSRVDAVHEQYRHEVAPISQGQASEVGHRSSEADSRAQYRHDEIEAGDLARNVQGFVGRALDAEPSSVDPIAVPVVGGEGPKP